MRVNISRCDVCARCGARADYFGAPCQQCGSRRQREALLLEAVGRLSVIVPKNSIITGELPGHVKHKTRKGRPLFYLIDWFDAKLPAPAELCNE